MKLSKKKYSSIFLALFLTVLLVSPTANASIGSLLYENTIGKILEDENSIRSLTLGVINGFIDGALVAIVGCPTDGIVDNYKDNSKPCNLLTNGQAMGNGSLYAMATYSLNDAIQAPMPTNLALYLGDVKGDSLVFREAQAASVNESIFNSILVMWKAVRNASYGLLAGAILVIAIMISLRSKMDPQTVVTAQAAIPKIVISAVLITFSYAIGALFGTSAALFGPLTKIAISFISGNVGNTGFVLKVGPQIAAANCPPSYSGGQISNMTGLSDCTVYTIGKVLTNSVNPGAAILVIIAFLITIILLFAITFVYITKYLKIVLLTIFAPIIFAIAAIPGQENRIKDWFLDMISATLAIPAMVFTVIFAYYIFLTTAWAPGVSTGLDGFIGSFFSAILGGMMLVATLLLALKVPGLIENTLKPKKR